MVAVELKSVALIEEHTDRSWPPLESVELSGWRMRWSGERKNHRPNSVLPPIESPLSSDEFVDRVSTVERFYSNRSGRALFQVIDHPSHQELVAYLLQQNYKRTEPSEVQQASIADIMRTRQVRAPGNVARVSILESLDESWIAAWRGLSQATAVDLQKFQKQLELVQFQGAFAMAQAGSRWVAVGRASYSDGWLGVFNMITVPELRGRGLAGQIILALADWGRSHGADKSYLQVNQDNFSAKRAYLRNGYHRLYGYYYLRSLRLS
jgi:GNAT superfamily N-acetyltransferase